MNGYKYRANIAVNDKGNLRDIETLIKDELWASSLTDLNDMTLSLPSNQNAHLSLQLTLLYLLTKQVYPFSQDQTKP